MENVCMDEKWKLSKKGSYRNYSKSRREQSTSAASSSTSSGAHLKRSSSMPESVKSVRRPSSGSVSGPGSGLGPEPSPRKFSSRCANLVKEQRAKFYIVRRCVTMLMCWRDYP